MTDKDRARAAATLMLVENGQTGAFLRPEGCVMAYRLDDYFVFMVIDGPGADGEHLVSTCPCAHATTPLLRLMTLLGTKGDETCDSP